MLGEIWNLQKKAFLKILRVSALLPAHGSVTELLKSLLFFTSIVFAIVQSILMVV